MLCKAERVFTFGARSSKSLAMYFGYLLGSFRKEVYQLSHDPGFIYDRILLNVTKKDIIVFCSAWPCTKETINIANFCHSRGVPIALITNTNLNPITKVATSVIDTNSVNYSSGGTALMAVLEVIAEEVGRKMAPESTRNIEKIESTLKDNDLIFWGY